jgi:hypothetical protein
MADQPADHDLNFIRSANLYPECSQYHKVVQDGVVDSTASAIRVLILFVT